MADRIPIAFHMELLCVCASPLVYISRRALKHVVERRKVEIAKNNSQKETTRTLYFLFEIAIKAMKKPDRYIHELPDKHIYFWFGKPTVRVITEKKSGHLEIKTIHFIRHKNTIY